MPQNVNFRQHVRVDPLQSVFIRDFSVTYSTYLINRMASYWKSQPRKFCTYCKCWLTDNKPSVDFHEKGKRHQENVKLKIEELKKKSIDDAQRQEELDDDIQKMEKAALEAFKKDLAENPALALKYNVKLPEKEPEEELSTFGPRLPTESEKLKYQWNEAVSPQGYHYYWNTKTNESLWEKPEHYVSLLEQGLNEDGTEIVMSEEADEEKEDNPEDPSSDIGDITRQSLQDERSPYGSWTTVKPEPFQDLQLPIEPMPIEEIPLPPPEEEIEEEKIEKPRFKEKRVQSLGSNPGEIVSFKKRKLGAGSRNRKQREDDS